MPATPAFTQLSDELDTLRATKVSYLRVVDVAIADGIVTQEEQQRIRIERRLLKASFRIVNRRVRRMASGNRLLRFLASTGEPTEKFDRLYRELREDEARIGNVIPFPGDDPDDGAPNVKAA